MPPKKKKVVANGFTMYMLEMQQQILEEQGRRVPIPQLVEVANPQWKRLSPEEKAPYNEEAKRYKKEQKNAPAGGQSNQKPKKPVDNRMDSTRNLISNRVSVNDQLRERREKERTLLTQNWPEGNGVCQQKFHFIAFQSLCKLPENMGYLPCELACIEYTLKDGITRTFHRFLYPGPIPMGYRYMCQSNSENTHQIPVEGHENATRDYQKVFKDLVTFVNPTNQRITPPIFCESSQREMVEWCLKWLADLSGISHSLRKVIELELLMTELYGHAEQIAHSWSTFTNMLGDSKWDHMNNTRCEYHEELDVAIHKCALGVTKKYCFHLSDPIAIDVYDVTITDNHLPERSDADGVAAIVYPKITPAFDRRPQNTEPPPPPTARTYRTQPRPDVPDQPIRRPMTDFAHTQQTSQYYASNEPEAPSPSTVPMPNFQWQSQAASDPYADTGGIDRLTRHLQTTSIERPNGPLYPGIGRGLGRGMTRNPLPQPGMNPPPPPGMNPPPGMGPPPGMPTRPQAVVGIGRGIGRGYQRYGAE